MNRKKQYGAAGECRIERYSLPESGKQFLGQTPQSLYIAR